MEQEKLIGQVGNWVAGERFWNREREVEQLCEYLDDGMHIMLVAPRRVGKTSLMHHVAGRLEDRYHCLFVDVENCERPEDAIVEISKKTRRVSSLWTRTKEVFRDVFATVSDHVDSMGSAELSVRFRDGCIGRWQQRGDQLLKALASADRPVIIFIDELPILVNRILNQGGSTVTEEGRHQGDLFLSWLRSAAQSQQSQLRFVVSGSIGFGPVLGRAKLSASMNHFAKFHLDAWDAETAQGCLRALANYRQLRFVDGAETEATDLLGLCIPHHVQALFDLLYADAKKAGRQTIDPFEVRQVYQQEMLSIRGHSELKHYEERLSMVLDDELFPLAIEILTEAALADEGIGDEDAQFLWGQARGGTHDPGEDLRTIFEILDHDGYLEKSGNDWVFKSKLLRDWWRARFGAYFTPVAERRGEE